MKKTLLALLTGFMLFGSVPRATAAVTVVATLSPDSISVGGTVDLDLKLNLFADNSNFFDPVFTGGFVTLFSGDGQHHSFFISPGGTTKDIEWEFTYSNVGNYIPSFLGLVSYSEKFLKKEDDYKWKCRGGCEPKYEVEKVFKLDVLHGQFVDPEVIGDPNDVTVSAAAPEISTWLMMLLGFAGIGFVAYRRANKSIPAFATV